MKPELKITKAFAPDAGGGLARLRVECVFCDEAGAEVRRRSVSLLSLLVPRGKMSRLSGRHFGGGGSRFSAV